MLDKDKVLGVVVIVVAVDMVDIKSVANSGSEPSSGPVWVGLKPSNMMIW